MDERTHRIKKAGIQISIYMGVTMSFFLSLLGNILSGHFSLLLFLVTFAMSTTISFVIGLLVPMGIITSKATANMKPDSLGAKCLSSLISDLIYTPVLSLSMIALVRIMVPPAVREGLPPFPVMFIGSLIPSLIVGFFLIMIFMPYYKKKVTAKLDLDRPPEPPVKEE